jgi:hypothetical protein
MVWNPDGKSPTVMHPSFEKAKEEAERLGTKDNGKYFFVLEAKTVSYVSPLTKELK